MAVLQATEISGSLTLTAPLRVPALSNTSIGNLSAQEKAQLVLSSTDGDLHRHDASNIVRGFGYQGLTGAIGAKGSDGSAGASGYTGLQGLQGADGGTGPQGDRDGTKGPTGDAGATGAKGDNNSQTGPQGPAGAQGPKGSAGYQGYMGSVGGGGGGGTRGSRIKVEQEVRKVLKVQRELLVIRDIMVTLVAQEPQALQVGHIKLWIVTLHLHLILRQ